MRAFIALVVAGVATGSRDVGDELSLMQITRLSESATGGEDGGTPDECTEVITFGSSDPSNTYSNLGGLGPDNDSPKTEIRLSSIGTDHVSGADFDIVIQNTSTYFPNSITSNKVLNDNWVQINNAPGATTNLSVNFVNKGTDTPLQLHVTKMTLCDIDWFSNLNGKKNVSEEYVITADAFYMVDEPEFSYSFDRPISTTTLPSAANSSRFVKKITAEDGVSPLRVTVKATIEGTGCDNPKSADSFEVYTYVSPPCNVKFVNRTPVDQAKRCLMFELDDSTGFQLDFITEESLAPGASSATAGRNLMLGAASAYFDTAEPCTPTASPTASPTAAPTDAPTTTGAPSTDAPTTTGAPSTDAPTTTGAPSTNAPTTTAAPTDAPTPAGITGDPHVTNVDGQRFNVVRVGVHELLRLPRRSGSPPGQGVASRDALLEVLGTVEGERKCAEPFVRQLDLSGLWLQRSGPLVLRAGGLGEDSRDAIILQVNGSHVGEDELARDAGLQGLLQVTKPPTTRHGKPHGGRAHRHKFLTLKFRFSGATLTVDWVHREAPGSTLNHLDLHVADLPRLGKGMDVGGILGRDDHTSAAKAGPGCVPTQSLVHLPTGSLDVSGSLLRAFYEQ